MRHFRAAIWFCLGFLLVGLPMLAFAETIPASSGWVITWNGTFANETLVQACARAIAANPSAGVVYHSVSTTSPYKCNGSLPTTPSVIYGSYGAISPGPACPWNQNWTLVGSTCTRPDCVAPQVLNASGVCVAPPCPAAGQSGASLGATGTFTGSGNIPSVLCVNGCQYNTGGVGVQAGNAWATGIGLSTGATCSSNTGAALPASDPQTDPKTKCVESGQAFGTVNGVVVCTPATTTVTKGSGSSTTTNKDPQGNTTSTSTTSTSTSTSTTNISGGGSSKTTTTTTTNPDGSTTTTTTTGEGVGDGEGEDEDDDWGTPPEEGALSEQSIGPSSITPVSMGGSGACPAPIALPHNWGSVSYQPACDLAGMIKPITLAFAWLAAVLIAVGGFKDA